MSKYPEVDEHDAHLRELANMAHRADAQGKRKLVSELAKNLSHTAEVLIYDPDNAHVLDEEQREALHKVYILLGKLERFTD